jgi:hypothetical protein
MKRSSKKNEQALQKTAQKPADLKALQFVKQGMSAGVRKQKGSTLEVAMAKTREKLANELVAEMDKAAGVPLMIADHLTSQMENALVWPKPRDETDLHIKAVITLAEHAPQNVIEASLAVQMTATKEAALMFLHRATTEGQTTEGTDLNVVRATRLMRLHLEQIEAMQKLKGKSGQQTVTVEHVHVHEGGQAIVGPVTTTKAEGGWGAIAMPKPTPHEKRRGRLKNGNPPGDFTRAARCGAKTRRGTPCQCPAMANGRCRLHGGLSTGPKTAEGIERIRRAQLKHGRYTKRAKAERAEYRELLRACRDMLADLSCL